jgi:hypothetical protein
MYLLCNKAWTLLGYLSFNDASFRFLSVPDSSSNKRSYVLGLKDFKLWATLAQNRLNSLITDCRSRVKGRWFLVLEKPVLSGWRRRELLLGHDNRLSLHQPSTDVRPRLLPLQIESLRPWLSGFFQVFVFVFLPKLMRIKLHLKTFYVFAFTVKVI